MKRHQIALLLLVHAPLIFGPSIPLGLKVSSIALAVGSGHKAEEIESRTRDAVPLGAAVSSTSLSVKETAVPRNLKRQFTVADEIQIANFGDRAGSVGFSPDRSYFAAFIERGLPERNRVEDSLVIFQSEAVGLYASATGVDSRPAPVWIVRADTSMTGPVITKWRWLRDSSAIAYLEKAADGRRMLKLANVAERAVSLLSLEGEDVVGFDIVDKKNLVYTVAEQMSAVRARFGEGRSAATVTGSYLYELLQPNDPRFKDYPFRPTNLKRVVGGKSSTVAFNGVPVTIVDQKFALSPNANSIVTTSPVLDVPVSWQNLFLPPHTMPSYRIRAGKQDISPNSHIGFRTVRQYVRIDLNTGELHALGDAPVAAAAGWAAGGDPKWSADGSAVLLPATFVLQKIGSLSHTPCVAVANVENAQASCVEHLMPFEKSGRRETFRRVVDAEFVGGTALQVRVNAATEQLSAGDFRTYKFSMASSSWESVEQRGREGTSGELSILVSESMNEPPTLQVRGAAGNKILWDPNPQLKVINLGNARVYTWRDADGRSWRGGLYLPRQNAQRVPLVIQTHGFRADNFEPSGRYPTAFAARALAASGIAVLQVDDDICANGTPRESSCAVAGYEAAINKLTQDGTADKERLGIIGFSRTCYYVLEALTSSDLKFRAASITDGVMQSYSQFLASIDSKDGMVEDSIAVVGQPPFGAGLSTWVERSPGFKMDRIHTPLLVVGGGPFGILYMWEPYAALRFQKKPVEIIMLDTTEHVLTNPAVRVASQQGSVEWFRFWLKGEEDGSVQKEEQYSRWKLLRSMQGESRRE